MNESRLVYSTGTGRVCPECGCPRTRCVCKKGKSKPENRAAGDGIIRVKREVKGRGGKTVTTISGFPDNDVELKKLASQLKNRCGSGGSVKDGVIILQGDHREALKVELMNLGLKVKLAGG